MTIVYGVAAVVNEFGGSSLPLPSSDAPTGLHERGMRVPVVADRDIATASSTQRWPPRVAWPNATRPSLCLPTVAHHAAIVVAVGKAYDTRAWVARARDGDHAPHSPALSRSTIRPILTSAT